MSTIYNYDPPRAQAAYAEATKGQKSPNAGKTLVMADAINATLNELMEVRPEIVMWGEDVADLSKEHFARNELEGKGGVFGITKGLQRKYGPDRVSNSPIAEASIVGRASGWALQGYLPIVEVQFRDYLSPAWQQLVDQVATMRWRSDGRFSNPLVVRMAYGGYLGGAGAIWHSESANGPILHYPGVRLCVPSNAEDMSDWVYRHEFTTTTMAIDPEARLFQYAPASAFPLHILLDTKTMQIKWLCVGGKGAAGNGCDTETAVIDTLASL
jgi:2-oxoisovalerate dehydrogenase E1 component